jgi:hypothetical protein
VLSTDATTFDVRGSGGGRDGGSGYPSDGPGFWPFIDIQAAAAMQHGRLAEDT